MPDRAYSVPGISCDHYKQAIETEVAKLDGVDAVAVDVAERVVTVSGSVTDDDVRQAIDEAGYEVESVSGA